MRLFFATLGAIAVQPIVLLASLIPVYLTSMESLDGLGFLIAAVLGVSFAVMVCLGLPAFFLLHRYRLDSWLTIAAAGIILGALPLGIFWPRQLPGYSAGNNWHGTYVETYTDGEPTRFAWFQYVERLAVYSPHGLAGALMFYAIWRAYKSLR